MIEFTMPRPFAIPFHLSRDAFRQRTLPVLLRNTRNGHKKFIRMDSSDFNFLVRRLRSRLERQTFIRKPISVEERLLIALRHLSSGDSYKSLSFLFRVAPCTIGRIVLEVCNAILDILQPEFLKTPSSAPEWQEVAKGFGRRWHLRQCLGARKISKKLLSVDCSQLLSAESSVKPKLIIFLQSSVELETAFSRCTLI